METNLVPTFVFYHLKFCLDPFTSIVWNNHSPTFVFAMLHISLSYACRSPCLELTKYKMASKHAFCTVGWTCITVSARYGLGLRLKMHATFTFWFIFWSIILVYSICCCGFLPVTCHIYFFLLPSLHDHCQTIDHSVCLKSCGEIKSCGFVCQGRG